MVFTTVGILSAISGAIGKALFGSNDDMEAIEKELMETKVDIVKMSEKLK